MLSALGTLAANNDRRLTHCIFVSSCSAGICASSTRQLLEAGKVPSKGSERPSTQRDPWLEKRSELFHSDTSPVLRDSVRTEVFYSVASAGALDELLCVSKFSACSECARRRFAFELRTELSELTRFPHRRFRDA